MWGNEFTTSREHVACKQIHMLCCHLPLFLCSAQEQMFPQLSGRNTPSGTWTHAFTARRHQSYSEGNVNTRERPALAMLWTLSDRVHLCTRECARHAATWQANLLENHWTCAAKFSQSRELIWHSRARCSSISRAISPSMPPGLGSISEPGCEPEKKHCS